MCEIYYDECTVCKKLIEIHLGDYETGRLEIDVFCNEHIPSNNVVIWQGKDYWYSTNLQEHLMVGNPITVGVHALTKNARKNKDMNSPNLNCDIIEERN